MVILNKLVVVVVVVDSRYKFIVVDNIGSNSSRKSFKILVGTG